MYQSDPAQTFLIEAEELLGVIEELALKLQADPASADAGAVNQLFRAFHTIKGSGGMFGFEAVAEFTHHVESALDDVRSGRASLSKETLECILAARDHIKALLEAPAGFDRNAGAEGRRIVDALCAACGRRAEPAAASGAQAAAAVQLAPAGAEQSWHIHFRPNPEILVSGGNPAALLAELRQLGPCSVIADTDRVPPLEQLQPDRCHVSWEIDIRTSAGLNALKDVFIFVEDGSELAITPIPAAGEKLHAPAHAKHSGSVHPHHGGEHHGAAAAKALAKESVVRVPSVKLDRLVNLVGELVMTQSRLNQVAARLDDPDLAFSSEQIERLINELRDEVLGIRMMPIGSTFGRFKRLVHDLSRELGKEIELVTEGAETELDKTVLDRLGDPLVHLIRNSIDHGIESAETRRQGGKPQAGTIRLSAAHTGSSVVVTIRDDGQGIDRESVRRKALEKGLISAEAAVPDAELLNLVFLPGFSTAKKVTNVSGRGVGMDVVKREIEALRGTVSIESTVGAGTAISLSLPLTLAIVDGLLVSVGGDTFVIPMSAVAENVELTRDQREAFNGRHVLPVRGALIPFVSLRELFDMPDHGAGLERIVIVQHAGERVGLVVDRVIGSHQTVIQALGRFYRDLRVFSGATIMGDGRVALILDVAGIVRTAEAETRKSSPSL
ncbi:chemotaxis protein CheA [Opitutaceae bacterium EW11]|nr:chemotaxis protein CheA [Opitutaceae bacterium EW11]